MPLGPSPDKNFKVTLAERTKNDGTGITRDARAWLDDLLVLFPVQLPTMQICSIAGENVYGKCSCANMLLCHENVA